MNILHMKTIKFLSFAFIGSVLLTSCNDDNDSAPVNEEEVLTTITTTLTPVAGAPIILQSRDMDGDGPNEPIVTVSGNLTAGATYNGMVSILNELSNPADDVTAEIFEEGVDHQFFFQATNGTVASTAYADVDANGKPIGIQFTLAAGTAGNGNLTVILRHEPNKSGVNVATGDITNAGGETDIQVVFPIVVQ